MNQNIIFLEHVCCDYCNESSYKIRYRKPDSWLWLNQFEYPVVECINCGLVYVNPRPTVESMNNFYPLSYFDSRDSESHIKRYIIQEQFIPKLANQKILDIGCAKGDFLIFLKKKYKNITPVGVDFYSKSFNSDEILFFNKELHDCSFLDNEFDLITAWAVFEHLHQPSLYFQEVNRILKPGGKFIFLVTNSESLYGKKANWEDVPRHTYHFSEKSLLNYANKFGFHFEKCVYDDRIFDGSGKGTFYFGFQKLLGVTWEKRYFNHLNFLQKKIGKIGQILDKIVFKKKWESQLNRSGIIVVTFEKK